MTFEQLKLMPQLLTNVRKSGYETPTPIQAATIPLVLEGKDILGCAQTGTGKTAAFSLPMLQKLALREKQPDEAKVIRALILTPTRELALQIYENIVMYGKKLPVSACCIFGGVNQQGQINALHRGAEIVVACPGRLWDLMNQGYVRLDWVDTFVLDEADRMLDMGFIHDVRRIAGKLPEKHQTLLFSATMPEEVEKLAMDLLKNPASVKVDPVSSPVEKIEQSLYYVDKANKKHLLAKLLRESDVENALVFSRTKHGADRIVRDLKRAGIDAVAIHGDKTQNARQAALTRFKTGECKVLVATDIAARGIDIAGLSHVFNFDQPMEAEAYVHRIGRTGRAGRAGKAISFCCIDEMKQLHQVEKLIGHRIPLKESEWPMEITTPSEPKQRLSRQERAEQKLNAVIGNRAKPDPNAVRKLTEGQAITIGRDGKMHIAGMKPAKTERAEKPVRAARPAKAAAAKTERTARPARAERGQKPVKAERSAERAKLDTPRIHRQGSANIRREAPAEAYEGFRSAARNTARPQQKINTRSIAAKGKPVQRVNKKKGMSRT
ncbi:MAG: DEAD/DEAH box helicase [Clostridia bacterium]|nr:DEAD/DEAH box helicase [Clostridia bacterium]